MDTESILLDYIQKAFVRGRKNGIQTDEDLLSAGVLDSLGILQLVSFVEKRFNRSIPVEDIVYENFHSVAALATYLSQNERL